MLKRALLVSGLIALVAAAGAQASVIDFTKSADWGALSGSSYTSPTSFGGVTVTISSLGGTLTFNPGESPATSCGGVTGLACNGDGIGIVDDEVTIGTLGTGEMLTVHFSSPVKINSIGFLDLFGAYSLSGDAAAERAMWRYAATAGSEDGFLLGTDVTSNPILGWALTGALNAGWYTDITFFATNPPASSNTDFSLAKIDFSTAVPDSGMTLILLGGALIGLGVLRRKFGV